MYYCVLSCRRRYSQVWPRPVLLLLLVSLLSTASLAATARNLLQNTPHGCIPGYSWDGGVCKACGWGFRCPGGYNPREACTRFEGTNSAFASECGPISCDPCPTARPDVYLCTGGQSKPGSGVWRMPNFSPTERNDVQFLCNLQGIAGQVGDIAISAYGDLLAVDTGNPATLWVVESEALKALPPSAAFNSPPACPITEVTQLRAGAQYTGVAIGFMSNILYASTAAGDVDTLKVDRVIGKLTAQVVSSVRIPCDPLSVVIENTGGTDVTAGSDGNVYRLCARDASQAYNGARFTVGPDGILTGNYAYVARNLINRNPGSLDSAYQNAGAFCTNTQVYAANVDAAKKNIPGSGGTVGAFWPFGIGQTGVKRPVDGSALLPTMIPVFSQIATNTTIQLQDRLRVNGAATAPSCAFPEEIPVSGAISMQVQYDVPAGYVPTERPLLTVYASNGTLLCSYSSPTEVPLTGRYVVPPSAQSMCGNLQLNSSVSVASNLSDAFSGQDALQSLPTKVSCFDGANYDIVSLATVAGVAADVELTLPLITCVVRYIARPYRKVSLQAKYVLPNGYSPPATPLGFSFVRQADNAPLCTTTQVSVIPNTSTFASPAPTTSVCEKLWDGATYTLTVDSDPLAGTDLVGRTLQLRCYDDATGALVVEAPLNTPNITFNTTVDLTSCVAVYNGTVSPPSPPPDNPPPTPNNTPSPPPDNPPSPTPPNNNPPPPTPPNSPPPSSPPSLTPPDNNPPPPTPPSSPPSPTPPDSNPPPPTPQNNPPSSPPSSPPPNNNPPPPTPPSSPPSPTPPNNNPPPPTPPSSPPSPTPPDSNPPPPTPQNNPPSSPPSSPPPNNNPPPPTPPSSPPSPTPSDSNPPPPTPQNNPPSSPPSSPPPNNNPPPPTPPSSPPSPTPPDNNPPPPTPPDNNPPPPTPPDNNPPPPSPPNSPPPDNPPSPPNCPAGCCPCTGRRLLSAFDAAQTPAIDSPLQSKYSPKGFGPLKEDMKPQPCPLGHFAAGRAGACKPCPEGSTTASERSHSQSQCNVCLPGFKAVVTCMPEAGAGPSGETTEQEQSQQQNITHTRHLEQPQTQPKKLWQPLRKLRQQRRQLLASFHSGWQPWKQQVQIQVPAGFADAGAGRDPVECPNGTFSPGGAGASCQRCPQGSTTSEPGAGRARDCDVCLPGYRATLACRPVVRPKAEKTPQYRTTAPYGTTSAPQYRTAAP